jgi:putative restriction endonuclease
VIQRIGQDVLRDALMEYWGGCRWITGITDPRCYLAHRAVGRTAETSSPRRLRRPAALVPRDAAFDQGLVSFADNGAVLASPRLSEIARKALDFANAPQLSGLRGAHRANLALHRIRNQF